VNFITASFDVTARSRRGVFSPLQVNHRSLLSNVIWTTCRRVFERAKSLRGTAKSHRAGPEWQRIDVNNYVKRVAFNGNNATE
jgi:hypothetical protein